MQIDSGWFSEQDHGQSGGDTSRSARRFRFANADAASTREPRLTTAVDRETTSANDVRAKMTESTRQRLPILQPCPGFARPQTWRVQGRMSVACARIAVLCKL